MKHPAIYIVIYRMKLSGIFVTGIPIPSESVVGWFWCTRRISIDGAKLYGVRLGRVVRDWPWRWSGVMEHLMVVVL